MTIRCDSCRPRDFGDGAAMAAATAGSGYTPAWDSITAGLQQLATIFTPTPSAPATNYTPVQTRAAVGGSYSNLLLFGAVGLAAYLLFGKRRRARR